MKVHTEPSDAYALFDVVVFNYEGDEYKFEVTHTILKPLTANFDVFIKKMNLQRNISVNKINDLFVATNKDLQIINETIALMQNIVIRRTQLKNALEKLK